MPRKKKKPDRTILWCMRAAFAIAVGSVVISEFEFAAVAVLLGLFLAVLLKSGLSAEELSQRAFHKRK